MAQRFGYDEININVGCPSSRVATKGNTPPFTSYIICLTKLFLLHRKERSLCAYGMRLPLTGCFGAALMKTPDRVRDIVSAIKRQVQIPVTVKCRIGVDEYDSSEFLYDFIQVLKFPSAFTAVTESA